MKLIFNLIKKNTSYWYSGVLMSKSKKGEFANQRAKDAILKIIQ